MRVPCAQAALGAQGAVESDRLLPQVEVMVVAPDPLVKRGRERVRQQRLHAQALGQARLRPRAPKRQNLKQQGAAEAGAGAALGGCRHQCCLAAALHGGHVLPPCAEEGLGSVACGCGQKPASHSGPTSASMQAQSQPQSASNSTTTHLHASEGVLPAQDGPQQRSQARAAVRKLLRWGHAQAPHADDRAAVLPAQRNTALELGQDLCRVQSSGCERVLQP